MFTLSPWGACVPREREREGGSDGGRKIGREREGRKRGKIC